MTCPLSPADRERFAMERDLLGYLPRCGKRFEVPHNFPDDDSCATATISYQEVFHELCTLPMGHGGACTCCFRSSGGDECFARRPADMPLDLLRRYSEISCCS